MSTTAEQRVIDYMQQQEEQKRKRRMKEAHEVRTHTHNAFHTHTSYITTPRLSTDP